MYMSLTEQTGEIQSKNNSKPLDATNLGSDGQQYALTCCPLIKH